jgi:hypothetical protein
MAFYGVICMGELRKTITCLLPGTPTTNIPNVTGKVVPVFN